jgi:hypothetical protein
MGSAIASDSRASARTPNALTNVRTALGADAIATALIENLHCLQGKLPWQATRNYWCMALAYSVRDRMKGCCLSFGGVLDRISATASSISGSARPGGREDRIGNHPQRSLSE